MSHVTIPATGSGDATPQVSTDLVSGAHYQYVKLADGTVGGSAPATVDAAGNLRVGIGSAGPGVWFGASVSNFPANQTVTISGQPISVSGNVTASVIGYVGASIVGVPQMTLASSTIQVGVSVANYPTNIGSTTTFLASALPGVFVGASISNAGALSAASQVLVGGSTTVYVASQPAQTLTGLVGASISNTPQISIASYSVTQPVSLASTSVTQPVSGNVTASVIGYVGASLTGTPNVNVSNFPGTQAVSGNVTASVIGYVGASVAGPVTASVIGYVGASVTGGQITASTVGYLGASVTNFPATQTVSGNVTASVIGYVGASITNTPSVNSFNVGGSVTAFPAAAPVAGLGASPYHYVSGASVNQNLVRGAAATLYTVAAMNQNVNPRYLKLFDKSGVPSPGTDLPVQTYMLPGASAGAGALPTFPVGLLFANGIGFAITANISDTDATAVGASDVVVNLSFR